MTVPAEPAATLAYGVVGPLRRAGYTAAISFAVAASLLTFPSAIPWMIAFWLTWHTVLTWRRRPGWFPLAACLAIIFVKRIPWPALFLALALAMLAAGAISIPRIRERLPLNHRRLAWIGVTVMWAAWLGTTIEWHAAAHTGRRPELDEKRPVVCIGDSLTSGMSREGGYPRVLGRMLSVPVLDLSRPGITSAMALRDLPAIIAADPQAVVVELGGHDYLKGLGCASTKANLEKFIGAAREVGAEVVLMEIPRGFITDPFAGLERELAREHDLELVSDTAIRKLVVWGPRYSEDGLHPNARGNALLAGYIAAALERVFGPAVRVTEEE